MFVSYKICFSLLIVSRPWVEYKGVIPQNEMQNKQKELELEANALISVGGKVSYSVYELLFMWYLVLKTFTLPFRFLLIYYCMMKLPSFVVVVFLIMFPRLVYKRYILTCK